MKQANPERKPSLEPWVEVVGDITMSILAYRAERIGQPRGERTRRAATPRGFEGPYGTDCGGGFSVCGGTDGVAGWDTGGVDGAGVGVTVTDGLAQAGDAETGEAGVTPGVTRADVRALTAGEATAQLGVPVTGLGVGVTAAVGRGVD
jgi:hypothetical protein